MRILDHNKRPKEEKKFSSLGFSLVELMIVVSIIGILTAIAVPQYKQYQAKSKLPEVKALLSSIYVVEISFFGEYGLFHTCIQDMGIVVNRGYYVWGTNVAQVTPPPVEANCDPATSRYQPGTIKATGGLAASTALVIDGLVNDPTFEIHAYGQIQSPGPADQWSINEDKFIQHEVVGY